VVKSSQVLAGNTAYKKTRERLTLEVNAAVQAAIDGGAKAILAPDGHGANNAVKLIYKKLH